MPIADLDPSMALGFLFATHWEWESFRIEFEKVRIRCIYVFTHVDSQRQLMYYQYS